MTDRTRPTDRQLEFLDWELGLFLHFGIRTFHEGHRDWDNRAMDPAVFDPVLLDCDQWMAVAKEAGVRYAVLTAKHHDGFANWPSKHTEFCVAASGWRGGRGDVVREFVDAARRHGIEPGLYYSPAQWGGAGPQMSDPKAYDDYFIHQISEILSGYGPISVLWFDGCGSQDHQYDWPRIVREVRRLQPQVLIAHLGDPDFRWVGNECGIAPGPQWNVVEGVPFQSRNVLVDPGDAPRFLPAECDCMIRDRNWFFEQADRFTVKSVEELVGMYDLSVGRGANLLINIGPDRRGLLPEDDAARLIEFGRAVRKRYGSPIARLEACEAGETDDRPTWSFTPPSPQLFNCAVVQEDLRAGQRIRRFAIRGEGYVGGQEPILLHEGANPGHKVICHFPPARLRRIWLEITATEGDALPALRQLEFHHLA